MSPASPESSARWIQPVLGRADDMRAEVWLRCDLRTPANDSGSAVLAVSGTLTGPECSTAATLPTTIALVDQGHVEGQPPLARGVCTEPGFWTPELPNLYRADVVVRSGDGIVSTGRRMVGLRRLGVRGRSLWLDGRRFVPRGIAHEVGEGPLEALRSLAAVAVVNDSDDTPFDEDLSEADRIGVGVIIRLEAQPAAPAAIGRFVDWIDSLAAHPSSLLLILPRSLTCAASGILITAAARRRGTMLLGQEVDGTAPPPPLPVGLDCVIVSLPPGKVPHEAWQRPPGLPVLASCGTGPRLPAAAARAECDRLQARLAAWARPECREQPWDWAGYLVR